MTQMAFVQDRNGLEFGAVCLSNQRLSCRSFNFSADMASTLSSLMRREVSLPADALTKWSILELKADSNHQVWPLCNTACSTKLFDPTFSPAFNYNFHINKRNGRYAQLFNLWWMLVQSAKVFALSKERAYQHNYPITSTVKGSRLEINI